MRKQLLREVGYVADTRTALKAFRGAVVRRMTVGLLDRSTPQFELELLLRAQLEGAKLQPQAPAQEVLGQVGQR